MNSKNKNIWVFLPDGVGLRNFAFGKFYDVSKENGLSLCYWNNTKFPLKEKLNLLEVSINNAKNHFLSDLFKRAKKEIELNLSYKASKNPAYLSYSFPVSNRGFKNTLKNVIVSIFKKVYNSQKGLERIRKNIGSLERKTSYYRASLAQLQKEKPALVFCTNQRPILGVAPILAAKDSGIPTVGFIFSWDNLPKGILVIETDYYFVWSDHMKQELLEYYPHIKEDAIFVTGSPQFEGHFNTELQVTKKEFFSTYGLDLNKKYICFSGDDITTSPYDQYYLEDLAEIIQEMNANGYNIGIIYRKCPVDFSDRHLKIIEKYKAIITCIDPLWSNLGNGWDSVMPLKEDMQLLSNTIRHSELVINVGSSMVFDAISHNKPCAYINYNTSKGDKKKWTIEKIYKYLHFQSMPSKEAVLWVNSKQDYKELIKNSLKESTHTEHTKEWFDKICVSPQKDASKNIIEAINHIIN